MAASRENGVDDRLNVGGSIRVKVPVRRLLRIPMRLLPRVGERPAGADMGELGPRARLLSFLAGDFGFKMDRTRGDAPPLRGLLKTEAEMPSLLLGNAEVEEDLVMMNVGGLKSLLAPSEVLPFDRLEKRSAGSTFSKSSTLRKSAALRFPGDDNGMAVDSLALFHYPVLRWQHSTTRPAQSQSSLNTQAKGQGSVTKKAGSSCEKLTGLLVSRACQALKSCPVKGRERLAGDSCHCGREKSRGSPTDKQTNTVGHVRRAWSWSLLLGRCTIRWGS